MGDTILVTGAAGFAGSHLLDLLEAEGASIVAWRRPGDPLPPGRTGFELPWMDVELLDRARVREAVESSQPAVVYHCAGAAHVGQSWDRTRQTLEVNVLGTWHLLSALSEQRRAPRVLVPGSALVYRQADHPLAEDDPIGPTSPYGLSKLAQERMAIRAVSELHLPVLLTRSFNHIGPRQDPSFFASSFARQIARIEAGTQAPVITVGNLQARRDLSDVRDTVRAYRAIVERGEPGRPYNVCTGRAHAIQEILDGLVRLARVAIAVEVDPGLLRPSDTTLVVGDGHRALAEIGWEPTIPLSRTLSDLLEHWRDSVSRDS